MFLDSWCSTNSVFMIGRNGGVGSTEKQESLYDSQAETLEGKDW